MPTQPLMTRFWTVARTRSPQRERNMNRNTPAVVTAVRAMTTSPLMGISMLSVTG